MTPVVHSRSTSFQKFLDDHLDIPLEFNSTLPAPCENKRRVHLLHLSSLDAEYCQFWLKQHAASGQASIAVCSDKPNIQEMLDYVPLGIRGYCNSHMAALHYRQLLQMLDQGQSWFPPELLQQTFKLAQQATQPTSPPPTLDSLTERENEIAAYIAEGLSNRKIAERLGISEPTVKTHVTRIYKKLDLSDRVGLVLHLKRA